MKELLEQGIGVVIIGGVTAVGIIVRMILFGYYARLGKACKQFEKTRNRTITYIRDELNRRSKSNRGIKNATVYTECRLAECKVCGIRIGILECMMQQSLLIVPLSGVLAAFAAVILQCKGLTILLMLFGSSVAVFLLLLLDLFTGMKERHRRVRLAIRDYVENCWIFQTEDEESVTELRRKDRRVLRKERKKEKKVEKKAERNNRNADKPKRVTAKKNGKAQEEKRRLTEELLRERRQLEARSFAQQRKQEQEQERPVQPAQEEAVVTECPVQQVPEEVAVTVCPVRQVPEEATTTVCSVRQVQEEAAVAECPEPVYEEQQTRRKEEMPASVVSETKTQEFSYEELLSEVLAEYLA